jgi:hypothetical protein
VQNERGTGQFRKRALIRGINALKRFGAGGGRLL